jgi:predicted metalloprotease
MLASSTNIKEKETTNETKEARVGTQKNKNLKRKQEVTMRNKLEKFRSLITEDTVGLWKGLLKTKNQQTNSSPGGVLLKPALMGVSNYRPLKNLGHQLGMR